MTAADNVGIAIKAENVSSSDNEAKAQGHHMVSIVLYFALLFMISLIHERGHAYECASNGRKYTYGLTVSVGTRYAMGIV